MTRTRTRPKLSPAVIHYIREVRTIKIAPRATWEDLAFIRLRNKMAEDVHAEFMREYRATMRFLADQEAMKEMYAYAHKEHPENYEKTQKDDIAFINKYFRGWADDVKPEKMAGIINHYLPLAGELGGQQAINDLGLGIAFNLRNPQIMAELKERGVKITGNISANTLQDFRDTLYRTYMEEGMNPREVAREIKGMFEETYKNRSMTISRTECGIAQMNVQNETYVRNGVKKKRWLAIIDANTRDSHIAMDGKVVDIDEPFPNGLMYPLDPTGPPEEIINCRCDYEAFDVKEEDIPQVPWTGQPDAVAEEKPPAPAIPGVPPAIAGQRGYIAREHPTYKPITGEIGSEARVVSRLKSRGYNMDKITEIQRYTKDVGLNIYRHFGVRTPFIKQAFAQGTAMPLSSRKARALTIAQRARQLRTDLSALQATVLKTKVRNLVHSVNYKRYYVQDIPGGGTRIDPGALASTSEFGGSAPITIYELGLTRSWLGEAWRHEIGHRYEGYYASKVRAPWIAYYKNARNFISDYAQVNQAEAFAETFAFYTMAPGVVADRVPEAAKIMKTILPKYFEATPVRQNIQTRINI